MSLWYIWLNAVTGPQGETRFVPASYINSPVSYTVSQVTLSFLLCSDIIILSACFTFFLKLGKHLFSGRGWGFSVHIDLIDTDMIRGATGWMSVPRCHGKGQITVLALSKVSCHCQCCYSGKQDLSGSKHMNRFLYLSPLSPFFLLIQIVQKSLLLTVMSCPLINTMIALFSDHEREGVIVKQQLTPLTFIVWAKRMRVNTWWQNKKNCVNYPFDHFTVFVFSSYGVKECEDYSLFK